MWAVSDDYLRALMGSHEMVTQVDVFDDGGIIRADVPIEDGQITATLMSDVTRSGQLSVTWHLIDAGLFDPLSHKVRIQTGIPGWPLIPIFTGRVQDVVEGDNGLAQVTVADAGQDVVDADFEQPWRTVRPTLIPAEMQRILLDLDPAFGLNVTTPSTADTPDITWESSRGEALDKLAAAINSVWQANRVGSFDLYANPYQQTPPPALALVLSDGPGGTLTSCVATSSRDKVKNSITLVVERADNSPPIRVTVRDDRAGSPTLWGGKFGKSNRVVRLQTVLSYAEARSVAQRILSQSLALARSWRLVTPHFPVLDPGDVIGVWRRRRFSAQVVETVSYPLRAISGTTIATRELRTIDQEPT